MKKIFLIAEMSYGQSAWSFKHVFEKNWYDVMAYEIFEQYFPQNKWRGLLDKVAWGLNLLCNMVRINLFFPFAQIEQYQPDVIFIFKWTHIFSSTIQELRKRFPKVKLVNCNLDHPFVDYNTSMSYIKSIKYYDIHLTCKKYVMRTMESAWAKKMSYITCRYDEKLMPTDTQVTENDRKKYACDILFIGTRDHKRDQILWRIAEKFDVKIYGNNRDRSCDPAIKKAWQWVAIYGEEFVKAVKVAKINFNILRLQDKYSLNLKNMEIPWCGWVLLTEWSEEIEELFAESKASIYTWKNRDEIEEKINNILTREYKDTQIDTRFEINHVFAWFLKDLED